MAAPPGGLLWRSQRAYQIWGANTDVGKTVFATMLASSVMYTNNAQRHDHVYYMKPVSTGPLKEADDKYVLNFLRKRNKGKDNRLFGSSCFVQYEEPISPHAAAALSDQAVVSDSDILAAVYKYAAFHSVIPSSRLENPSSWFFCETAGGVHSPAPSGTSQADLYRPLRLPAILIGDSKLGGISATISAFESLRIRGYDVEAVLLFQNDKYNNHVHLADYFKGFGIPCTAVPMPNWRQNAGLPPEDDSALEDNSAPEDRLAHDESKKSKQVESERSKYMVNYFSSTARSHPIRNTIKYLNSRHQLRLTQLGSMSKQAHDTIWYPFTQQKLLSPEKITAIDSASGDFFHTFDSNPDPYDPKKQLAPPSHLRPSFDGSASWWTQGLGHGNPKLTLAAAYAAGRYGHVMFAEAVHAPALQLAQMLLKGSQNPRLERVFYSDNGSTGVEVAVKMALRAARVRYGWDAKEDLGILGLKGSYHGDTMGAMDCSEPSVYNEKIEWYRGKGHWLDFPTIKMVDGEWKIDVPKAMQDTVGRSLNVDNLSYVFNFAVRDKSKLAGRYEAHITSTLEELQKQGKKFGALMLEPVVLGAGGMHFVDPLFQRTLISIVRRSPHLFSPGAEPPNDDSTTWSGLPVVFDEVFTGLYRLGHFTSGNLLKSHADISVHAKLLTGGLLPLAATLASSTIFDAFASNDKSDALLHGHSYTAHPIGCTVATESLTTLQRLETDNAWSDFKTAWASTATQPATGFVGAAAWSVWHPAFVKALSRREKVRSAWALGSVLAIELEGVAGYSSNAARALQAELADGKDWDVHSRVLGNVLYLMTGQMTKVKTVRALERRVEDAKALGGEERV